MDEGRRHHVIEMIVRADTPIAHGSETIGNSQLANREKVVLPNGRIEWVPIVSGSAARHNLREAGTAACLAASGLRGKLTESALRLLYNGGVMKSSGGDVVRTEEYRKMSDLVPHIAMLGGCIGNRIVEGKMEVGALTLICEESRHHLPAWQAEYLDAEDVHLNGASEHLAERQHVKMDALLSASTREMLLPEESARIDARLLASETASARGDSKGKRENKSQMMPHTFETVIRGSLFSWRIAAWTDTDIERDTLAVSLAGFFTLPLAGKSGTGHGRVSVVQARGHERIVDSAHELGALRVANDETHPSVVRYRAHMAERAPQIEEWLREVKA